MGAVQHVFRRGAIYWWRRRILQKVGERERAPIAISMNTSELFVARTIAAHLTLESERIMQEGKRKMLSAQQIKTMLSTAARVHLRKLDRLHALEIADGISAADGRRSDLITGWALRLKAARGPNATVETSDYPAIVASGLTEADVVEINQTIALLRERRTSDTPPAKILRMLEACGATQDQKKYRTLEPDQLFEWQLAVGVAFRASLAEGLIKNGFQLREAGRNQFEIAGIHENVIETFFKRSHQIEERVGRDATGAQKELAALATRAAKDEVPVGETLERRWREELAEIGVDPWAAARDFVPNLKVDKIVEHDLAPSEIEGTSPVAIAASKLFRHESVINRKDLLLSSLVEASRLGIGIDQVRADLQAYEQKGTLIKLAGEERAECWTTPSIAASEARLRRAADRLDEHDWFRAEVAEATLEHLRETQASLVEAEKLAALGRLLAGVAHEINGPVGIGLTVASSLQRRYEVFATEVGRGEIRRSSLKEFLDVVRDASVQLVASLNRASELVQSFKQVAADRSGLERRHFDLGDLTEQVLVGLQPELRKRGLALNLTCEPALTMDSLPGPYGLVLSNLVLNSIVHAFPDGRPGTITFNASALEDDTIEIVLSDDGCGMIPQVRRQAFDPFFTTCRHEGATGLGLHIAHSMVVDRLGGRLTLDSEPGVGTTVRLILPRSIRFELESAAFENVKLFDEERGDP